MELNRHKWIVLLIGVLMTRTTHGQYRDDSEYYYSDPDMDDSISLNSQIHHRPKKYIFSGMPSPYADAPFTAAPIECITEKSGTTPDSGAEVVTTVPNESAGSSTVLSEVVSPTLSPKSELNDTTEFGAGASGVSTQASISSTSTVVPPQPTQQVLQPPGEGSGVPETTAQPPAAGGTINIKSNELRKLMQHLYMAQTRVQLEAQAVANSAQQQLAEAANHVRAITAAMQSAQQEVAAAAICAQTAQLQLAARDQLLSAARQDVEALSSQMVGLQVAEGILAPLLDVDKPTAIPAIVQATTTTPKTGGSQSNQVVRKAKAQRHNVNSNCMLQDFYFD